MKNADAITLLNDALAREMGSVLTLWHHSFQVRGPHRRALVDLLRSNARSSLEQAALLGEHITSMGGHPTIEVHTPHDDGHQSLNDMLAEDLTNQEAIIELYEDSLSLLTDNVALEQLFRNLILEKVLFADELRKTLDP